MKHQALVLAFKTLLAEAIKWALSPPSKPGPFALTVIGEHRVPNGVDMARANVTEITLPAVPEGNPDGVVRRDFTIKATGAEDFLFNHAYTPEESVPAIVVNLVQGVEVTLSLVDQDQAGNKSEPRTFTFTPTDVTPPHMPGEFTMKVSGEKDV